MALSHIISWKDISLALLIWNTMNILKNMDIQDTCMNSRMNTPICLLMYRKMRKKAYTMFKKKRSDSISEKALQPRKFKNIIGLWVWNKTGAHRTITSTALKKWQGKYLWMSVVPKAIHHWKLSKKPNMFICLSRTSNGWKPSELPSNHGRIKWRLSKSM